MLSHLGSYRGPLVVLSVLASCLLLWITANGLSIAPDSVEYLSAAENLIEGQGLSVSYTVDEPVPLTLFPPGYPLAVGSTARLLGTDVVTAARWLNAASFGVTVFLAGALVHSATGSLLLSLLGSIVFLSSAPLLAVHSYAESDPLFLSLTLLGLLLLSRHCERPSRSRLIAAATIFGLAFLTRYVGIALILTGVAILVAPARGRPRRITRRSLADAALLLAIGVLPSIAWTILNRGLAPGMADRDVSFHFMPFRQAAKLLLTVAGLSQPMVSRHVVPGVPSMIRVGALVFMSALVLVIVIAMLRDRERPFVKSLFLGAPRKAVEVLGIFLVLYPLVVIFSILFVDLETYFDMRIALPVYSCIVILVVSFVYRLHRSGPRLTTWKTGLWLLLLTFLGSQSVAGILWTARNEGVPAGYASATWKNSPLIAKVGELPPGARIHSNMPDAILFLTGRSADWIPAKVSYTSGLLNPSYSEEIVEMRKHVAAGGVVVIFDRVDRSWLAPSTELIDQLNLQPFAVTVDGTIFAAGP